MAADLANIPVASAIFFATGASPAPKVFSAISGFEPFSSRFFLETMRDGAVAESVRVTPDVYQRLKGPYNRRNVFGAVFAGGPILMQSPRTAPMIESVLNYGLCGPNPPLVDELELPRGDSYRLRVVPKHHVTLPMVLAPSCSR